MTVKNINGQQAIDSREVAEMVGKQHKHLLRDIASYIEIMEKAGEPKFGPSDFFILSSYVSAQNKELPCYLITKKGCDMIANKLTGEKGVLFTAAYVTAFEEMQVRFHSHTNRRIPEVSPSGLAKLISINRRVLLDMGASPVEVGTMTRSILDTYAIPVPVAFSNYIPEQLSLYDLPAFTEGGAEHAENP